MTRAEAILTMFGVALLVSSAPGTNTAAGRRRFDEMAGMIPFFAAVAGGARLVVAAGLFCFGLSRR